MRWCVIRHPDLGVAVVAERSLAVHKPRGWLRVSEAVADKDSLRSADYADAPDLDAPPEVPADLEPDAGQEPPVVKTKAPAGKRDN